MQRLDKKGVSFCTRTTHDDNAITNAVEIYESLRYFSYYLAIFVLVFRNVVWHGNFFSGATHFIAANNDSGVREYDIEKFQLLNQLHFPWPVNVSTLKHSEIRFFFLPLWPSIICATYHLLLIQLILPNIQMIQPCRSFEFLDWLTLNKPFHCSGTNEELKIRLAWKLKQY